MITGVVQSEEGRIRLKVKGLRGREQEVEAVIELLPIGPAPTLLPRMALPLLTDHPLKAIEL